MQKLHFDVLDKYELDKKSELAFSPQKFKCVSSSRPVKIPKESTQTTMNMFHFGKQKAGKPVANTVLKMKIFSLVANGLLPLSLDELKEFKDLLLC